ncbi:MAG: metallophosphoesterase [Proteobacteria bacterium]|nr:metallophosphoesterase [Pseudomonadota bacterium]
MLIVVSLSAGCLDVASDRARRDDGVGRAEAHGVALDVRDGLAAIREIDATGASLWAGAPTLALSLRNRDAQPRRYTLTLDNILPDATLVAATASGPIQPLLLERPKPKTASWQIMLQPSSTVRAALRVHDTEQMGPWSFGVFGDVQRAVDAVEDIYRAMNRHPLRFVIIVGDLTSRGTRQELAFFQHKLDVLDVPCYATLGNHELITPSVPYHDYFGRGSSRFSFRGVQFVLLDTASGTVAPGVYHWLDQWLSNAATLPLRAVFAHIAPFEPAGIRGGSFNSHAEAARFVDRLARGRVDLTVYGHVHSYYAFQNGGIPAFITGGGGAIPERFDGVGRHFLRVDVEPRDRRLETTMLRVDGR